MKFFTYAITYPFILLTSRLPMRLLYFFSDIIFFLLYYIIGYRKKVVTYNLKTAYPQKSDKEIKDLSKKFFKHFIDLIFESIKSFTISKKELVKRYTYKNPELVNNLTKQGKSIALVGAHQANWEWAFGLPFVLDINCFGAYTKIQNPYFEKKIKASRTKFGFKGVPTGIFNKTISSREANNLQTLYILLSDQSPQLHKTRYWTHFLNEKVPVHTGAEILAKKYNLIVVNMHTKKIKRGYFETEFELITDSPKDFDNFQITDAFLNITEKNIHKQPECYLWSHKRFKHKDKYDKWLKIRKTPQK